MKRVWSRAIVAASLACLGAPLVGVSPAHAADEVTINLVLTNDFHGRIDENLVQWAATVDELLSDAPAENSLFLGAGDSVGMSVPASEEQDDNPTIDVLNLLGMDASGVGNHEFDQGYDDLTGHLMERADFPILGANVEKADGTPALDASATFTVDGVRVAVIGAVTAATPDLVVHQDGISGLRFTDPVAAINRTADQLDALPAVERPDVMVALVHEGSTYNQWLPGQEADDDAVFARLVEETSPEIDVIATGHTHKHYAVQAPVPGDPARTRPVIQAGEHGSHVGQVKLTVDRDTGTVLSSVARTVERTTESDEALIANRPFLAQFATLRDEAVAYATQRIAAREEAQKDYDAAVLTAETNRDAADQLASDYHEAKVARNDAYGAWLGVKGQIDTLMKQSRDSYAQAAELKTRFDALVAEGQRSYGQAAAYRDEYQAALADGRAAYGEAAELKQRYQVLVEEGRTANAEAADVKLRYDTRLAEARAASAEAADLKAQYDALYAESAQAYADVVAIRDEYASVQAAGGPDAADTLAALSTAYYERLVEANTLASEAAALKDPYFAAVARAQAAYGDLATLTQQYQDARATAQAAYAGAAELKPPFDAAMATATAAFQRLEALQTPYNEAMASAQSAYAEAATLQEPYYAAIASAQKAQSDATLLKPAYDTALAAANAAEQTLAAVKKLLDDAVTLWKQSLATVDALKVTLLGLL